MKLFGEFLVERGLVSEKDLVDAIIEQISLTPSLPVLVHQYGLLTHGELIRALGHQARSKKDFKSACQELGLWTDLHEAKVEELLAALRIPIGQILIKKNLLSFEVLRRSLDEFFADQKNGSKTTITSPATSVPMVKDLGPVTPEKASRLVGLMSPAFLAELRKRLVSLSAAAAPAKAEILAVYLAFHELRGIGSFLQIGSFGSFSAVLERTYFHALKGSHSPVPEVLSAKGFEGLECLVEFKSAHIWSEKKTSQIDVSIARLTEELQFINVSKSEASVA
jgi:hypothetical protein